MTLIHNALIVADGATAPLYRMAHIHRRQNHCHGCRTARCSHTRHCRRTIDAGGAYLLPGAIDCHVHFREPGLTHKATIASESKAALAGGVTSYIEMPNTKPVTTTIAAWEDKMQRASMSSAANYSFMIGAAADNLGRAAKGRLHPHCRSQGVHGFVYRQYAARQRLIAARCFADQAGRIVVHAEDQSVIDSNIARFSPPPDPDNMLWHTRLRSNEARIRATERAP